MQVSDSRREFRTLIRYHSGFRSPHSCASVRTRLLRLIMITLEQAGWAWYAHKFLTWIPVDVFSSSHTLTAPVMDLAFDTCYKDIRQKSSDLIRGFTKNALSHSHIVLVMDLVFHTREHTFYSLPNTSNTSNDSPANLTTLEFDVAEHQSAKALVDLEPTPISQDASWHTRQKWFKQGTLVYLHNVK